MLAIDGMTLRRSIDRAASTSPLHVVSAFASDRRLVLGLAAAGETGNEITAARDLLALLDLDGLLGSHRTFPDLLRSKRRRLRLR